MPDPKGQVTPKPESSSKPAKKAKGAVKAERQLQKRQHPKKTSFQKQNGVPKGADSELSTGPSVTKVQASSKLQGNGQPAEKAMVIRKPKVTGKLKQQAPKLQSSKKVAFRRQNASSKGMETELPSGLSLPKTLATWKPENCVQSQGAEKAKQQVPQKPSKKAAFQKQNGTPKGPQTPALSSLSASRPPPAKRRKSQPLLS